MIEKLQAIGAEVSRLLLALVLITQNAGILWWCLSHSMPDLSKELQLMIVNGAGLLAGVVVNYYFGSSAGSAAKDRALQQNAAKP
jgi:hypothetical protein